jgi:type 1 glutamine amidotransferase
MNRRAFVGSVAGGIATGSLAAAERKPAILIVVGPSSHPPGTHEVAAGGRLMKHNLENISNSKPISADVVDKWPADASTLEKYTSLVFIGDIFPPMRMAETQKILKDIGAMMDRGCGIVCVHYATGLSKNDVAEDGEHPLLHWMGGYFATGCKHHKSIARLFPKATITPASSDHPIQRGWKEFTINDEPYINNYFGKDGNKLAPNVTAIATSMLPPENPKAEVVAWAVDRKDGGKGFGIVMPHFYRNWNDENLRRCILNGIVWSAGAEVPKEGIITRLPDLEQFQPDSVEPKPRPAKPAAPKKST